MRSVILGSLMFLISGCSVVQILYTAPASDGLKEVEHQIIFENDSIKIIYGFWSERGVMSFVIENKLQIPIYIDWKKSAFINSSIKLDYYKDKVVTKAEKKTVYEDYLFQNTYDWSKWYPGVLGISELSSATYREERVTFIPPHSIMERVSFNIVPALVCFNMDSATRDKANNKVLTATKETSKIHFRNFITYSTREDFQTENYIDNEFYVRQVIEVKKDKLDSYAEAARFYIVPPYD